jgi:large subunit ribosomal protein L20
MKTHKKKIFEFSKGFSGRRKNAWTIAIRAVHRAWSNSYIGRRQRKREYRALWVTRINAASRQFGVKYSELVRFLPAAGVDLNRSVLSSLAATEPYTFRALVEVARAQMERERAEARARVEARDAAVGAAAAGDAGGKVVEGRGELR